MGIRPTGSKNEVRTHFAQVKKKVDTAIFMTLSRIGEQLVNYARTIPADAGYTDRTGNLRSSTGYVVIANGSIVKSDFAGGGGVSAGETYASEIAQNHKNGYALIVVAGMEYALAVESRGKDVLTTTEYLAFDTMPAQVKKLKKAIEGMKL